MSKRKPAVDINAAIDLSSGRIRKLILRVKSAKMVEKFPLDFMCHFSSTVKIFKDTEGNHVFKWLPPTFLPGVFPDALFGNGNASDQTGFEGCTLVEQVSALLTVTVHPNGDLNIVMDLPQ